MLETIKKRAVGALLVLALVIAALPALSVHAARTGIDNFNAADQNIQDPTSPPPASSSVSYGSSIGGTRDMVVTQNSGNQVTANTGDFGDYLSYNQDTLTYGTLEVVWDADSDPSTIDYTGLGGVDLTDGGTNVGIFIFLVANDQTFPLILTIWTDASNWSSFTYNVPALQTNLLIQMPFASFVVGGGSGADFTNVGAIRMEIDGSSAPALDATFDWVTSDVGAPSDATVDGL